MTFEAGALAFRLQLVGAEVFESDATKADMAMVSLGNSAAAAGKKATNAGSDVETLGKKSKAAAPSIDDTAKATEKAGTASEKAAPKIKQTTKSVEELRAEANQARTTIGSAFLGIGAAIATAAVIAVARFANFDEGMSTVRASTHATRAEIDALADSAIDAGADTAFSAREAADAENELAKAGIGVADILSGSLRGSLSLAAAGQLDVARAAEIAATTLKVFRLEGDQTEHVADLLAAAAGKAQGSVDDIALALDYAGVGLAQFNVPLEESVGTLALFAANGILGEKAGTGLRGVLASLTGPSAIGSATMKQYGINVFDAQGKFIGLAGVADQLSGGLDKLSEKERSAALNRIFGNESMNAALVLYKSGAEGVQKWTGLVNESGYAALTAGINQDNLAGDVEKLGGSFDSALVQTGSSANDVLRDMVQITTFLIDSYGSLDPAAQGAALALGVGAAAVLLLGGTVLVAVPKIAEFRLALKTLDTSMGAVAAKGGVAVLAVTAIIAILAAVAGANADAAAKTQAYGDTLDKTTLKVTNSTRELAKQNLAVKGTFLGLETGADSAFDAAEKIGLSLETVTDAATGNAEALQLVQDRLKEIEGMSTAEKREEFGITNGAEAEASAYRVAEAVKGETSSIEEAIRVAEQKAAVDRESITINENAAESYGTVEAKVDGVVSSIKDLASELDALNGKNLDARAAARNLEAAYDDFDAAIKKNGDSLDITTEKGRENQTALDAIAEAALTSGKAITEAGGGYEEYRASLEKSRGALLDRIDDLGITGAKAEELADKILRIPAETEWKLYAETDAAQSSIDRFLTRNDGRRIRVQIDAQGESTYTVQGTKISFKANGGFVDGKGRDVQYFAQGGRNENHVAQIERAGAMRVWAEPETGGEAYIPMSLAKRPRSMQILTDVADEFGADVVPRGQRSLASGGRAGASSGASSSSATAPMQIEGTLDLGNGMTGYIRATVVDVLDDVADQINGGLSK